MPIKWMRSVMLIITYAVFLVLAVIKFDVILDLAGQVLTSCRPLVLGFAIYTEPALCLLLPPL